MPEMNGRDMCVAMKADPCLEAVPVIFLTALTEVSEKVRAFDVGGVDYITKPFQVEEVQARVKTHLALQRTTRELGGIAEGFTRKGARPCAAMAA
jgi:putative two-component system response regulator